MLRSGLLFGNDEDPDTPDVEHFVNSELGRATSGLAMHLANVGSLPGYDPVDAFVAPVWKNEAGRWALQAGGARAFPRSYVVEDVWVAEGVSESAGPLDFVWDIDGTPIPFRLHRPVVTMRLDVGRQSATEGVVAGILDTEELLATMRGVFGRADEAFGEGSALESLLNRIRQASDIMLSGQQDPDSECNGISMAFGFDASSVELDGFVEPRSLPEACPQ